MSGTVPMISVTNAELDELRTRLLATRWPTAWPLGEWDAGTGVGELRRLVEYWATDYDWRVHEAAINALPSGRANIDGTPVHYLRFDGELPEALPIVLTNGWPSSFLELTELAERLATPSRHGGNAADAFTVIVPSLPGFAFSPQRPSLTKFPQTHDLWHRLMHDELGFGRYAAHGSDLGAGVTSRLAEAYPEEVVGIHLMAVANPATHDVASLTGEEKAYLDSLAAWAAEEGGYQHEQSTRPLTLSYGLADSPTGLLAWIIEKYRAWSDCGGDLSRRFSDDFLLTQASLYWFTRDDLDVVQALLRVRHRCDQAGGVRDRPHGRRPVPGRPEPAAPQLGRAHLQHHEIHAHAARRTLRRPRRARTPHQRHH